MADGKTTWGHQEIDSWGHDNIFRKFASPVGSGGVVLRAQNMMGREEELGWLGEDRSARYLPLDIVGWS